MGFKAHGGLLKKLNKRHHKDAVGAMLDGLHHSTSAAVFAAALLLFYVWLDSIGEVTVRDHFKATFGAEDTKRWSHSELLHSALPTTNNALEAFIRSFKSQGTFYEVSSLDNFMNKVLPRFPYSRSRQDTQDSFAKEPVQAWRAAQLMLESGLMNHLAEEDTTPNVYMLSSAAFEYVKKVNAVN